MSVHSWSTIARYHAKIVQCAVVRTLELELIQTQMTQKPMLRAEVGMRVRCVAQTKQVRNDSGGREALAKFLGNFAKSEESACMLLFVFLRGGFSIHGHSANEEGVPVPSKPLMAQGQSNRRLAR